MILLAIARWPDLCSSSSSNNNNNTLFVSLLCFFFSFLFILFLFSFMYNTIHKHNEYKIDKITIINK